jgi:hypothetical protein
MNIHVEQPSIAERVTSIMQGMLSWRPEIEAALQHAGFSHTFDDITAMVINGHLTLHTFEDCFCLTQVTVWPQFTSYHFMIAGGKLESIIARKPFFEALAKAQGCKVMSFSGRPGWARALKNYGWEHKFTTMWSEIEQ